MGFRIRRSQSRDRGSELGVRVEIGVQNYKESMLA